MDELRRLISLHQVPAFFALVFLLSWPLFILVLVVLPHNMVLQGTAGTLAVFAPAIAATAVARVAEPTRVPASRRARWTVFVATWMLGWVALVLFAWKVRGARIEAPLLVFGAVLSLLPAFVASRACSGVAGVRENFRSLVRPRGSALWYLVALFAFPAVQIAGVIVTRAVQTEAVARDDLNTAIDPVAAVALFLHGFFFAGGINEESGWRGFGLRKLQARYCPLAAALIVWIFWALWHLPMDLTSGESASSILLNRAFFNAMWSVLLMWVFNRTKGSLLAPALAHPAMNTSGSVLPRTDAATILFAALVLYAIVSDRMWLKTSSAPPSAGSPAGPGTSGR